MPPRIWPEKPSFKNTAEEAIFNALYATLSSNDAILTNLHITDPKEGDCEIDVVALVQNLGVIVFETKGGHVTYNGQTFVQSDRREARPIQPYEQVLKNLYVFKAFLRPRWTYGNVKSEWMLGFPYSRFGKVDIPGIVRDRIIDSVDIESIQKNIISVMNFHSNKNPPQHMDWVAKAFEAVRGHSQLESDPATHVANSYLQIKQLTHERRAILDMIQENNRIYVRGPAGSGKSWLAFEQAKIWVDQGLRVGITNYNRGLASYMKRKVAEAGLEEQIGFVGNFHQFAESIASNIPGVHTLNSEWLRDPDQVAEVLAQIPEEQRFDAWVVDEAQDFEEPWWQVLFGTLKNPDTGKIAIFGDPEQSIYGDKSWPIEGFATIRLSENLRNSQQIAKSVESLIQERIKALGPDSFEVEYVEVESEDDVLETADDIVVRLTEEEFWNPGEIALLTTKYRHPVHAERRGDQDGYWNEFWEGSDVFYGTVQGFKGLERSVVVLAVNGIHENVDENDMMYVGMTRARDRLVVVGTNQSFIKKKPSQSTP